MNGDQVKGEIKNITGKIKEAAGEVVGDFDLVKNGKNDQAEGKLQKDYGDSKEQLKK